MMKLMDELRARKRWWILTRMKKTTGMWKLHANGKGKVVDLVADQ